MLARDAPRDEYFENLEDQLEAVAEHVRSHPQARVIDGARDIDDCMAGRCVGVSHCVEGGFHLGGGVPVIRRNCQRLAGLGVSYVTIAHLFDRQAATKRPRCRS